MEAKEFLRTVWIQEPKLKLYSEKEFTETMELYAKHKIEERNSSQLEPLVMQKIAEQLDVAKKALHKISFQTEDMFPPFRDIPRSKMVEIADEAIKEIEKLSNFSV